MRRDSRVDQRERRPARKPATPQIVLLGIAAAAVLGRQPTVRRRADAPANYFILNSDLFRSAYRPGAKPS